MDLIINYSSCLDGKGFRYIEKRVMEMLLFEFVISSYLFDIATAYTKSLWEFRREVRNNKGSFIPDLYNQEHQKALFRFLRKWKCRQFSNNYEVLSQAELIGWLQSTDVKKLLHGKTLRALSKKELNEIAASYQSLMEKTASYKHRGGKELRVRFGPAGASKILYSLNPEVVVPWDIDLRRELKYADTKSEFIRFHQYCQGVLEDLDKNCQSQGFDIESLSHKMGLEPVPFVELLNKYLMVKYSLKIQFPKIDQMKLWLKWHES